VGRKLSTTDIYEFLCANPDKSFSNKDLAIILGINIATAGANTKKLREKGYINYDIQKDIQNKRKLRYLFYCNKNRAPMFYTCSGATPRVDEHRMISPHIIKNKRLIEKNYHSSEIYLGEAPQPTRQLRY
jgi:hypothetical protein